MKQLSRGFLLMAMMFSLIFAPAVAYADFFDNIENAEQIHIMRENADYSKMRDYVNTYIETEQPESSDCIYKVQELLISKAEALDSIDEKIDDFDDSRSWTFDGVKSFSEGYCVVPRFDESQWFYVNLGFTGEDFIFFDNVAISIDGEVVYDSSVDEVITDVLGDGTVVEYEKCGYDILSDEDFEAMHESEKTVIRFMNTDTEEKVQHVLTDEEKAALYHCWQVARLRNEISEVYSGYKESDAYQQLLQNTEPFDCGNGYPMCPSGTKSRYNQQAKTTLDDEIFNGTDKQRKELEGNVYVVTGALSLDSHYKLALIVNEETLDIMDTEYMHEDGADYTMPEAGMVTNFILTYDHSNDFYLGAYEPMVMDVRAHK